MREEKKLFKLSLQFFGEDDNDFLDDVDTDDPDDTDGDFDNADGDFDEEFFDGDGDLYDGADGDADDGADDGAGDSADGDADNGAGDGADEDPSSVSGADTTSDVASATESVASSEEEGKAEGATANADLISELRALGYVGNDLAALTADMKAKREAKAAQEAKAQAKADRVDGKAHVRSSVPGKSASGDGTGGVNERRVISVAENAKISREEARRKLAKHARLIEGK